MFPLTGWFPFMKGAAAYRWFAQDSISFEKSLKVAIGFGKNESPNFRRDYSKPQNRLQLSSTCYWYQTEPHAPLPAMLSVTDRQPDPGAVIKEDLPSAQELRKRGVKLYMLAGRPEKEVIFAEPGYAAESKEGFAWIGWPAAVYHARASEKQVEIELKVPAGAAGKVRVFIIDADKFKGGRKEAISIAGKEVGAFDNFVAGKWIEQPLTADDTRSGKVIITATNAREDANAVVSIVEWVE
jgi:hypothetical protein